MEMQCNVNVNVKIKVIRTSLLQGHLTILTIRFQYVTQLDPVVLSMTTGTVPSSGRNETAAVTVQNGQMVEEHFTHGSH